MTKQKEDTPQRSGPKEEASFNDTVSDAKAFLDAQPKVTVMVPLDIGEKKGTQLSGGFNGYRWNIPKGIPVEVPKPIADIIMQSLGIYEEASAALRSPNDPDRPLRTDMQGTADQQA